MPQVRLGIVGLGYWAKNYIRILSEKNDAVIAAICDCDPAKLRAWSDRLPYAQAYSVPQELFCSNLDGVIITTPASTHYSLVLQALRNRLPILVEKPLTLGSREADIICNVAREYNVPLLVGHTYLFAEPIRKLREMLEQQVIGKVKYIFSLRANLGIIRQDCNVIWDLAPHDIAILLYLLKTHPLRLRTVTGCRKTPDKDHAVLGLEFPGDVIACVSVSWLWPEKIRKLTVVGTKGAICYEDKGFDSPLYLYHWPEEVVENLPIYNVPFEKLNPTIIPMPQREPLSQLLDHFLRCIAKKEQPLSNARFGAEVVRILEKICGNESEKHLVKEFVRGYHNGSA